VHLLAGSGLVDAHRAHAGRCPRVPGGDRRLL